MLKRGAVDGGSQSITRISYRYVVGADREVVADCILDLRLCSLAVGRAAI